MAPIDYRTRPNAEDAPPRSDQGRWPGYTKRDQAVTKFVLIVILVVMSWFCAGFLLSIKMHIK